MKTCPMLFKLGASSLVVLAGVMPSLLANAQTAISATTISASTTVATSTSSLTTTTTTSALVMVKGAVIGAPENVNFSGLAQVSTNVVTDPDFGAQPTVVLSIDMSNVTGVGASTGRKYVVSGQETMNRRLNAADLVQVTFPFYPSGGSLMSSRIGSVSFSLGFNVGTMKLTGASGQIASP
jgi:hypothetical protein